MYVLRTWLVRAVQVVEATYVATACGRVAAFKGDWVITESCGEQFVIPDDIFRAKYVQVEEVPLPPAAEIPSPPTEEAVAPLAEETPASIVEETTAPPPKKYAQKRPTNL